MFREISQAVWLGLLIVFKGKYQYASTIMAKLDQYVSYTALLYE